MRMFEAQTYDADLSDVFAIQSQIAQTITNQLEAKISAGRESSHCTAANH